MKRILNAIKMHGTIVKKKVLHDLYPSYSVFGMKKVSK
jgi:hypothetical protein